MVHGDAFVAIGPEDISTATRAVLENKYKIKVQVLGSKAEMGHVQELRITLNEAVKPTTEGVELEADPRHVEMTIRDLKLGTAKISQRSELRRQSPGGVESATVSAW